MDKIKESAMSFQKLLDKKYIFKVKHGQEIVNLILDFQESDFHHLVGLHYLKDIAIPRNPQKAFKNIMSETLTDDFLWKSKFIDNIKENHACVSERIIYFKYIERLLDQKNLIVRYVKNKNPYSSIRADYMIEATVNQRSIYIFLRKRSSNSSYCLCSFFVKDKNIYYGEKSYWIYKAKENVKTRERIVLLDHVNK